MQSVSQAGLRLRGEFGQLAPVLGLLGERVVLFEDLGQLLDSAEAAERVEVGRRRPGRHGRLAAGVVGQFRQAGQEDGGLGGFLVGLAVHAGVVEELAELHLLAGVERGRLGAEVGHGDLRLVKLTLRERHALVGGAEVTGGVQRDERGVHGVARPAVGTGLEGVADFLAALARADLGEHGRTDRVLFGRVGPVHRGQGRFVAVLGAVDDVGPAVVVGVLEVGEQPVERRLRGRFDLGHEVQFVPLAAATLEDLGAVDHVLMIWLRAASAVAPSSTCTQHSSAPSPAPPATPQPTNP